jgi:hypothetical protein
LAEISPAGDAPAWPGFDPGTALHPVIILPVDEAMCKSSMAATVSSPLSGVRFRPASLRSKPLTWPVYGSVIY